MANGTVNATVRINYHTHKTHNIVLCDMEPEHLIIHYTVLQIILTVHVLQSVFFLYFAAVYQSGSSSDSLALVFIACSQIQTFHCNLVTCSPGIYLITRHE